MKKTLTFSRATNMSATQSAETDYLDSYFYCRHRLIWWNTAHIKTFFGAVHTVGYSRSLYRTVINQSMLYFNIKTSFSDTSVQIDWINRGLSKVFISFVNLTYQTSTSRSNPIFFQITFFLISENAFFFPATVALVQFLLSTWRTWGTRFSMFDLEYLIMMHQKTLRNLK